MPNYSGIQKEAQLKALVFSDYFDSKNFGYEQEIGNIDFVVTDKNMRGDLFSVDAGASKHYLWAEAKKGIHDVFDMFTQLILTCKKTYENGEHLAPPWLGCFDETRIAFVAFYDILPIFNETDFNWNTVPNNHDTLDFIKARSKVEKLIGAKIVIYNFSADDHEIKEFVKTHFIRVEGFNTPPFRALKKGIKPRIQTPYENNIPRPFRAGLLISGATASIKNPITKDNFVQIYYKWVKDVLPFINMSKDEWEDYKSAGIIEGDFFRADIMSSNGGAIIYPSALTLNLSYGTGNTYNGSPENQKTY